MLRLLQLCKFGVPHCTQKFHFPTVKSRVYSSAPVSKVKETRLTRPKRVSTLDPQKLEPLDHVDFSSNQRCSLRYVDKDVWYSFRYEKDYVTGNWIPFPQGTSGFLYYDPGKHPTGTDGEIRFRITPSNDPTSFALGKDLQTSSGIPWRNTILQIAVHPSTRTLKDLLLAKSSVTPDTVQLCTKIMQHSIGFTPDFTPGILHSPQDPFSVPIHRKLRVWMIEHTRRKAFLLPIGELWRDQRKGFGALYPYTGTVQLAFERSTLPEHAEKRILVLRVLKIIKPLACVIPEYDGHVPVPQEGQLLPKSKHGGGAWDVAQHRAFLPLWQSLNKLTSTKIF